jgi:transcriptional regulator with XRE-family HTH domain
MRQGDEIFGRLVAVRRARLGLSQEELAARMHTSQSNVARIEKGRAASAGTLKRLAAALDVEPRTRPLWNSLGPRWLLEGLAIAVLMLAGLRLANTDSGESSHQMPQVLSAPPAAAPVAARGAQVKSRKTTRSEKRKAKRPEKKSPAPAPVVSEPSSPPAPAPKKRSPAPPQPVSEPVASSPPPSGGGGGSSDPPPQVQSDPPPQVQSGIGGSEGSHGIAPVGG